MMVDEYGQSNTEWTDSFEFYERNIFKRIRKLWRDHKYHANCQLAEIGTKEETKANRLRIKKDPIGLYIWILEV